MGKKGKQKHHKSGRRAMRSGSSREAKTRDINRIVLDFFKDNPRKSFSDKQVINKFLGYAKRSKIQQAIIDLLEQERIIVVPPGKLKFNRRDRSMMEYTGTVDLTRTGAAYVTCEGLEQDIYVAPRNTNRAFHGDTVKVDRILSSRRSRWEGVITEIVRRKREAFIGTVDRQKDTVFVIPDDRMIQVDFYIPEGKDRSAADRDKVVVSMQDWPSTSKNPYGEITEILGQSGSSDIEMQSILVENGFRLNFPEAVQREVNDLATVITPEEVSKRRDFRAVPTFTIDPDDAKDFDDALSFRRLDNGNFEVGVHIADVSHYVSPGSALDEEALKRATSVYLVDRVLPMFPEQLSNVICSLRPEEEKLCYSAVFEMDNHASVISQWFGRTVIYSDRRFTYNEAQELLDGGEGRFRDELQLLNRLAHALRKKRFSSGSLNFDSVEVKFKLDEHAKPIGVIVKERKDAHMLIEDFMLLANQQVARFAGLEKNESGLVPLVYRIHDLPDLDKLNDFRLFASRFGYQISLDSPKQITKSLNRFLDEVNGKPEQHLLENLAIRAMAKAAYSTENIGHYGLGFEHYVHFTSPIRRYPDVMVHRVLEAVLKKHKMPGSGEMEKKARHCSERERAAMQAERESVKYKMAEYMEDKVGEPMEGVISGVKNWGIYVDIPVYNCEGMIKAEYLDDDVYAYNEREMLFMGLHTGKRYQIGDAIMVTVESVDLGRRTIDLVPL
jgi:ribonuclease R